MLKHAILGIAGLCAVIVIPAATAGVAFAVDNMEATDAPDLTSVRAKIDAKNYAGALAELRDIAEEHQQADVYNLMGFTLRKTGDYRTSLTYYTKALELQPDHKGAHEYLGELYVETGDMPRAREQLATLTKLCPGGCEELDDLTNAIAAKASN